MNQKPCQFYSFLQAVRGNWRNALFIRCSGSLCPMIRQASCEGFLMAADASCQPIFLSVQTVRKLSGEAVAPKNALQFWSAARSGLLIPSFWNGIPLRTMYVRFYSYAQTGIPTSDDSAC